MKDAAKLTTSERQNLVDKGQARSDGSFPIRNKTDLAKAILALGRASNPQAAKAWIIKRARELNALDMLPGAWGITA